MTNYKMAGNRAAFRQRCQQALLHPVTLGALGILLLNDLILKGVWPNPWTTGKLSDLAWVIFASPLLAYLLSLATPGGRRTQRAIWLAAYIGLPGLYAAFNTFAPLHDAILRGLSLISGGAGGSPLDAADSLLIPLGLAIALWVWRRGRTTLTIGGQQIAMAAAGLAVFASIATSYPDPTVGVEEFQMTDQNELTAYCSGYGGGEYGGPFGPYKTTTGGLNWQLDSSDNYQWHSSIGRSEIAETPRGTYSISETGIMHSNSGSKPVYSTEYLLSSGDRWLQEHSTSHLWPQSIATVPLAIIYDSQSDNVIAAMGIQGVVVGTPDGKWTPVAVGPCRPTDFSFFGKIGIMLDSDDFYILSLFLPIAVVALVVSIAAMRLGTRRGCWAVLLRTTAIIFAVLASLDALFFLWTFEYYRDATDLLAEVRVTAGISIGLGLAVSAIALRVGSFANKLFLLGASAIAALALAAQITLALLVWVNSDFSPLFVKISVVVMAALTGYALQHYLTRKERAAIVERNSVEGWRR